MDTFLASHEPALRFAAFAVVLAVMAGWEALRPRRPLAAKRLARWPNNAGLLVVDALILRLAFPLLAVGVALWAEQSGFGLFNMTSLPVWGEIVLTLLILDFAVWAQHLAMHKVPVLWRLHRVHHSDTDFDVTTAVRFHPGEIALSMLYKMALVALLGAPVAAVILFEILLNATALFNHGNVSLPGAAERIVRGLIVTPDMHRVHHSAVRAETDSNYGFNLSVWDRLFRTYRAEPAAGHDGMTIGLDQFRAAGETRLDRLLWQPFRRDG